MTIEPPFPHLPADAWELFLNEELTPASSARLEEHLGSCADCRTVLERRDPSRLFGRLRGLEVRDEKWEGFWEGIQEQLDARVTPQGATPASGRSGLDLRVAFNALAGAAATVLGVLLLQGQLEPGPEFAQPSADMPCPPTAIVARAQSPPTCMEYLDLQSVSSFGEPEVRLFPDLEVPEAT